MASEFGVAPFGQRFEGNDALELRLKKNQGLKWLINGTIDIQWQCLLWTREEKQSIDAVRFTTGVRGFLFKRQLVEKSNPATVARLLC